MADIRTKKTGKKPHQVRFIDPTAKSGYGYKSFVTIKEAKYFAAQCELTEVDYSSLSKRIKIQEAVELWLSICEKIGRDGRETVEPQTLVEYRRRAKIICEYRWKSYLHEISPPDVIAFRSWLLENKSRDLSRRVLSSFHSIILEMKMQGYITTDPAAGITVKSNGRYDGLEVEIPSDNEASAIFSAIDELSNSEHKQKREAWLRFRPLFYLAGFSGMRPSEYRGLAWKDCNNQIITVSQRADKTGIIGPVKSKAAKRKIIIPSLVANMLSEWQEISKGCGEQLVFGAESGKPLLLNNLFTGAWVPLMTQAGLMKDVETLNGTKKWPKYKMYCLRHYFASKLIERGHDFKYIQQVMGHSKIEVTFNNYGHLIKGKEEEHKKAADDLAIDVLVGCGEFVAKVA